MFLICPIRWRWRLCKSSRPDYSLACFSATFTVLLLLTSCWLWEPALPLENNSFCFSISPWYPTGGEHWQLLASGGFQSSRVSALQLWAECHDLLKSWRERVSCWMCSNTWTSAKPFLFTLFYSTVASTLSRTRWAFSDQEQHNEQRFRLEDLQQETIRPFEKENRKGSRPFRMLACS